MELGNYRHDLLLHTLELSSSLMGVKCDASLKFSPKLTNTILPIIKQKDEVLLQVNGNVYILVYYINKIQSHGYFFTTEKFGVFKSQFGAIKRKCEKFSFNWRPCVYQKTLQNADGTVVYINNTTAILLLTTF